MCSEGFWDCYKQQESRSNCENPNPENLEQQGTAEAAQCKTGEGQTVQPEFRYRFLPQLLTSHQCGQFYAYVSRHS